MLSAASHPWHSRGVCLCPSKAQAQEKRRSKKRANPGKAQAQAKRQPRQIAGQAKRGSRRSQTSAEPTVLVRHLRPGVTVFAARLVAGASMWPRT